jgi:ubiquinone/menaquinone biosynthesis C-methylase UbiE
MKRTPAEQAQTERLEKSYVQLQSSVMLSIERDVCGCDYGGNSWTTLIEAQRLGELLGLKPGLRLLDLGAGSGWPGLYLAENSGCDVTLLDIPLAGLQIAADRACADQIAGACWLTCADAANIPFKDASFDALSHSDLLCCLQQKRAVLESCNRVTRRGGRMAFTVISTAANLGPEELQRALDVSPEFVESDEDYLALLSQTGWRLLESDDLSLDYAASCRRQIKAMNENKQGLIAVIGESDYAERHEKHSLKLSVLHDGLLRRELFVVTPA